MVSRKGKTNGDAAAAAGAGTMERAVIDRDGLDALIAALQDDGYQVTGPAVRDGAIVPGRLASGADLPMGWTDSQSGGHYRLEQGDPDRMFDYVVGPQSWKASLYPAEQLLFTARRGEHGFTVDEPRIDAPRLAFFGVRPCDLAAIRTLDTVFEGGPFTDTRYKTRREGVFIVAVNCARSAETCFCASMGTGPKAAGGYDLALTEITAEGRTRFLIEAGSERARPILANLPQQPAGTKDVEAAETAVDRAAKAQTRAMIPEVEALLKRNLESPHWDQVGKRCLNCSNCTLVCPTCFCSTVEDRTSLDGHEAERRRRWDSCFTMDFSYVHGGSIRRNSASRYRQWMTHKLATWHDQFGMSGCVGCGRCIAWCPVGIDITEEARAIADSEGRK